MAHNMKIIVHTICRLEKVCTDSLFAPTPVTKPYSSKRRAVHNTILSLSTAIMKLVFELWADRENPIIIIVYFKDRNYCTIRQIISWNFYFFLPYTIICISRYCDISLFLWKSIEELFRSIFIYCIILIINVLTILKRMKWVLWLVRIQYL